MPLNTITIPSELIEKITHDNCVVYVGAGLSMGAGLPNWQTLLENMIEWSLNHGVSFNNKADLKKMIREEKYLKVANIIVKRMGDQRFGEFLVSVFRKPGLRPTEAHLLLPKIPFVSVLTSNYDKLIESAYTIIRQGESVAVFTHSNNRDLAAVLSSKEFHVCPVGERNQAPPVFFAFGFSFGSPFRQFFPAQFLKFFRFFFGSFG